MITARVTQTEDGKWTYHATGVANDDETIDFWPDESFDAALHAAQDAEIRFGDYGVTVEIDDSD